MITPILSKPHTDAESSEDGAEARMRQALGKLGTPKSGKPDVPRRGTYQAKPGAGRHRFKQDGEVPVVRLTLAEGGRGLERHAQAPAASMRPEHEQAGETRNQGGAESARQLQELTEQLLATRTRLGHAELALGEAGRTAKARQEEGAALRLALDVAEASLAQVRAELAANERERQKLEQRQIVAHDPGAKKQARADTATGCKAGRPLGSTNRVRDQEPASEPKPVKWWAGD